MPKIFISYRRDDSSWPSNKLYKDLVDHFGKDNVFIDVYDILIGSNFVKVMEETVKNSDIILVIIGKHYTTIEENGIKRLFIENDHVAYEVSSALKQDKLVIPILVDNAIMPSKTALPNGMKELSHINGFSLREDYWEQSKERLIQALEKVEVGNKQIEGERPVNKTKGETDSNNTNNLIENNLVLARKLYEENDDKGSADIYKNYFDYEGLTPLDMKNIGELYSDLVFEGYTKDIHEAVRWYRKAAEQGNAIAQHKLGHCYENGIGVTQDCEAAVNLYKASAEQGNVNAQYNLGICYTNGIGVEKDYSAALKWFRKSAEQGNAAAQCNLAWYYDTGTGVQQNYKEAIKWYMNSAEQGYANAQYNLGQSYYHGEGVSQDYSAALEWYRKAAEQGKASAQYSTGVCYYNGKGVNKDHSVAEKWFRKSAKQGYQPAIDALKRFKA